MARVTVEDCTKKLQNRFELVVLASQRAKSISCGAHITVDRDNDKNAVISLREIALDNLDIDQLRQDLISSLQMRNKVDIIEEENLHAENQDVMITEVDLSDDNNHIFDEKEALDFHVDDIGEDKF